MLLRGKSALSLAYAEHRAVAGFVTYNLETTQAIVQAAETTGSPLLIQAGSSAFKHAGLRPLALLALYAAQSTEALIGVHLDHSRSLDEVETCIELGYTSVMVDGSHLAYADNVALTKAAVKAAKRSDVWVEAELGAVAGDEDRSTGATASAMTDADEAAQFVRSTGIDALAVAVGNVHGVAHPPPEIALDRLTQIAAATGIPLVLHGASGLSAETLLACLDRGVAKVNVNTELRSAFLASLDRTLPRAHPAADLVTVLDAARTAVAQHAASIVRLLTRQVPTGRPVDQ